jgi:type VI secretion system protein ImpL
VVDFANKILAQYYLITALIATFVAIVVGWLSFRPRSRWAWTLLIVLLAIGLVVLFEFWLPRVYPEVEPGLPIFGPQIWHWMLALTIGAIVAAVQVVRQIRRWRRATVAAAPTGRFPDIDAAWEAIGLKLSGARIDLTAQKVYLLLAPDEEWAAAQVRAAGLEPFAYGPDAPSPIHAYALAEGLLLSCAGASALGTGDAEGADRLEDVCEKLRAASPDAPILGGAVLLLPAEWASNPDAARQALAARDDLQLLRRALKVRAPVFAIFPQMESVPGLREFVARLPEAMRQGRCGFAVPSTQTFSGDLVQRGLAWLSGWFETWILSQMADDPLDQPGNGRLFCLGHEVRRRRPRWRAVVEAACAVHGDDEPTPFRGLYCTATGTGPDEQAFSAGLFRGARSRVLAEHVTVEWSEEALAEDRVYRRAALAIGLVGGLLTLIAWFSIVNLNSWWWIGFTLVIVAWLVVGTRLALR